jgi:hypothetical protein
MANSTRQDLQFEYDPLVELDGAPMLSRKRCSSVSRARLRFMRSWTVSSRFCVRRSSSSSRSKFSICSFVRARIALWASRSLARFLASCEGVKVETLLVPLTRMGVSPEKCAWRPATATSRGGSCGIPLRFPPDFDDSAEWLVMLTVWWCYPGALCTMGRVCLLLCCCVVSW